MANKPTKPNFPLGLESQDQSVFQEGILNNGVVEHGPDAVMTVPETPDASGVPSAVRYNEDDDQFEGYYNEGGWLPLGGGNGGRWELLPHAPSSLLQIGRAYLVDNIDGASTVVFPSPKRVGDSITVCDLFGKFSTYPLTVDGNGKSIYGSADSMTISTDNVSATFTWTGEARGWVITSGVGLGQGRVYSREIYSQILSATTPSITLSTQPSIVDVYVDGKRLKESLYTLDGYEVKFDPALASGSDVQIIQYIPIQLGAGGGGSGGTVITWEYNGGSAIGGETQIVLDVVVDSVSEIYIRGSRQQIGRGFTFDPATSTITLADELEAGDDVVVVINGDPTVYNQIDRSPQEVARANNVKNSEVILSTETNTVLDGKNIVYDVVAQTSWGIPTGIPAGAKINRVIGNILVYTPGNVSVNLIEIPSAYSLKSQLGSDYGSFLLNAKRKPLGEAVLAVSTAGLLYSSSWVSIMEYAHLVTNRPDPNDQTTWVWDPAIQAYLDDTGVLINQTPVNSNMKAKFPLVFPPGVFKIENSYLLERIAGSTGSLATIFMFIGSGMTSTIIQPMTEGQIAFTVQDCKINFRDIGFRSGADYQTCLVLGNKTLWKPVFHCNMTRVGASGFGKGLVIYLAFDSTFEDIFVQNISKMDVTGTQVSYGITIEKYEGPANGGTAGDGTGDDSNQLVFIRPTVETAKADNSILFNVAGRSTSLPHHAINLFGGHFETHNLKAKLLNLAFGYNVNMFGTVFSQNGPTIDSDNNPITTVYRGVYIENSQNVNMFGCRIGTTNRLASVGVSDTKFIKITGTSQNVNLINTHLIGPYNDISSERHNIDNIIDYSEATKGIKSFTVQGVTAGDYTSRPITKDIRISSIDGKKEYSFYTDNSGVLHLSYSTNIADSSTPTDLMTMDTSGNILTAADLTLGALAGTAATRRLSGNGGYIAFDTIGRVYFNAVSNSQQWVMGSAAFNPTTDNAFTLGQSGFRISASFVVKRQYTATVYDSAGNGSPEGVVTAGVGSTYRRLDGTAGTCFYVKESGTGNTGWVAK